MAKNESNEESVWGYLSSNGLSNERPAALIGDLKVMRKTEDELIVDVQTKETLGEEIETEPTSTHPSPYMVDKIMKLNAKLIGEYNLPRDTPRLRELKFKDHPTPVLMRDHNISPERLRSIFGERKRERS